MEVLSGYFFLIFEIQSQFQSIEEILEYKTSEK